MGKVKKPGIYEVQQAGRNNRVCLIKHTVYEGRARVEARMHRPVEDGGLQPTKEALMFYSLEDLQLVTEHLQKVAGEVKAVGLTLGKGKEAAQPKAKGKKEPKAKVEVPANVDLNV